MKWYKKQMDKLKKENPNISKLEGAGAIKNTGSTSEKNKSTKPVVHNPVAQRNRNRPKTDLG